MPTEAYSRRSFLDRGLQGAAAFALAAIDAQGLTADTAVAPGTRESAMKKFEISLAAWSVHRMFYAGKLKQIDMPELCRKEFDIGGLELVNSFFPSPQYSYCKDLLKRAARPERQNPADHVRRRGRHGPPRQNRAAAGRAQPPQVARHRRGAGLPLDPLQRGRREARRRRRDQPVRRELCGTGGVRPAGQAQRFIENHWGLSSDPDSLLAVIKKVNDPLLGTLPDFGNFPPEIDRYDAVRRMMPYAKAVSAKCYDI